MYTSQEIHIWDYFSVIIAFIIFMSFVWIYAFFVIQNFLIDKNEPSIQPPFGGIRKSIASGQRSRRR
uniref:Spiroplasma plectrovirus-related protein n=1 Tax=Ascaris lumbricoides TaxID=6252 RepID=A0A0M3IRB2_ASCLU